MTIYPNPSNNQFTIDIKLNNDYSGSSEIEIMNMYGQIVYQASTTISSGMLHEGVNSESILTGNYLVHVITAGKIFIKQITIQH